jgi:murein DD-endopeptidase MepM/ murein hydrolase activator NlpD
MKIQKSFSEKQPTKHIKTIALAGGLFLATAGAVYAADSITNLGSSKEVDSRTQKIDQINEKIAAYKKILELKNKQQDSLESQIDGIEAQTNSLNEQIGMNQEQLDSFNKEIEQMQRRIDEKGALVSQQKRILSELLRTYYQDFSYSVTPALLTPEETVDYLNNANWNTDVSQKVSELLDSVQDLRDSLAKEQASLDEKKQSVNDLQEQLTARTEYLQLSQINKEQLLSRTAEDAKKFDNKIDDLQEQKEALEQEITDIEAGKINQLVGLPKGSGLLGYPVKNPRMTQGYGKTSFSGNYKSGMHNGTDFADKVGTDILAAADGRVIGTGDLGQFAYGKWVTINHGNGLVTLYGHLSSIDVSPGDTVKRGDKIAEMGNTGFSTGSHVHFTVYAAKSYEVIPFSSAKGKKGPVGASVNPLRYLP